MLLLRPTPIGYNDRVVFWHMEMNADVKIPVGHIRMIF